jgi:hypothetical protein
MTANDCSGGGTPIPTVQPARLGSNDFAQEFQGQMRAGNVWLHGSMRVYRDQSGYTSGLSVSSRH